MKPDWHGIAAALAACLLLTILPGCGSVRYAHEPAPVVYTVEPAGAATGAAKIERQGGEDDCMWFLVGFYVFYYLVYGIVMVCAEVVRVCFQDDDDCAYIAP